MTCSTTTDILKVLIRKGKKKRREEKSKRRRKGEGGERGKEEERGKGEERRKGGERGRKEEYMLSYLSLESMRTVVNRPNWPNLL
jgi:hypothetical protein